MEVDLLKMKMLKELQQRNIAEATELANQSIHSLISLKAMS